MDLKAKYLSDKCSDPIEFLNQLRQTTEPIGGGTEYSDDGELVEYEVAIIAIDKETNALIKKATEWLKKNKDNPLIKCEDPCLSGYLTDEFIEDFRKAMKGE